MSVYEIITDKIIKKLESGVIPWHKPWISDSSQNFITKHQYRGINALLTGLSEYICVHTGLRLTRLWIYALGLKKERRLQ